MPSSLLRRRAARGWVRRKGSYLFRFEHDGREFTPMMNWPSQKNDVAAGPLGTRRTIGALGPLLGRVR